MKCCGTTIGILCALALLLFVGYKAAQNYGVERATFAEETIVLRDLNKATPKHVVEIWFWAVNHHSKRVLKECSHSKAGWDGIKKLELISIKELVFQAYHDSRAFTVRFKPFTRFGMETGFEDGGNYEWTFTVEQLKTGEHWRVVSCGMD